MAVAVIGHHMNLPALGQFGIHLRLRARRDLQHPIPGRHVIAGGEHLRKTDFEMVEIDVSAAAISRQKGSHPILRIERIARRGVIRCRRAPGIRGPLGLALGFALRAMAQGAVDVRAAGHAVDFWMPVPFGASTPVKKLHNSMSPPQSFGMFSAFIA